MKYFLISDIHGIHPKYIMNELIDKGFQNENLNHKLVVAGDIIDGFGFDHLVVNYLQSIEKQGQLIAVKGNHDFGSKGVPYQHQNGPANGTEQLTTLDKQWLKDLPYQLETPDFRLAHGMYIPAGMNLLNKETSSVWGCPALLESTLDDWWWMSPNDINSLMKMFPSIDDYAAALNDKPLFLGHFGVSTLTSKSDKITVDDNGFASFKNIHWLDSSVINSFKREGYRIKCKVLEVKAPIEKMLTKWEESAENSTAKRVGKSSLYMKRRGV